MQLREKFRCPSLKTFLVGLNLITILGVMAAAFIVSFHTQTMIAQAAAVPESLAPLIPICVDLTLVALAGNALYARIEGRSVRLPVFLILISSMISVFLNVYLAPKNFTGEFDAFLPTIIPEVIVSILIHSIPPFFLLLLTEVALSFISPEKTIQGGEISLPPHSKLPSKGNSSTSLTRKKPAKKQTAVATQTRIKSAKERRSRVAKMKAINPALTKRELAKEEQVTSRTIQSDLREIGRKSSPIKLAHDEQNSPTN